MPEVPFTGSEAVRLGLLDSAEVPALEPLLQRCRLRQVDAGGVVLAGNTANSAAGILLEGSLSVLLQPDDGPEVGSVAVGELVGEVSALTGSPTSA